MEKRISYVQFQSVKSVAKAIDPIVRKKNALIEKIKELAEEAKGYDAQIDALEAGIVQIVGFHVADLVKKVIEPTGKEINGKAVTVTKYLPTDMVSYDTATKQYVVHTEEQGNTPAPETESFSEPYNPISEETLTQPDNSDLF